MSAVAVAIGVGVAGIGMGLSASGGKDFDVWKPPKQGKEMTKALDWSSSNLDKMSRIGEGVTAYTTAETEKTMAKMMPWASGLAEKQSGIAGKWLEGEFSRAEMDQIMRAANSGAFASGMGTLGRSEIAGRRGLSMFTQDVSGRQLAGAGLSGSLQNWYGNALQIARGGVYNIGSLIPNPMDWEKEATNTSWKQWESTVAEAGQPTTMEKVGSGLGQMGGMISGGMFGGGTAAMQQDNTMALLLALRGGTGSAQPYSSTFQPTGIQAPSMFFS
jgi:hypothetical protein